MEEKLYFRIKEVAEIVNENPSTIRYWENEFDELKPKRGGKGRRLYTSKDVDTIRKIKFLLRDKGMHISKAQEQLRVNNKNISTKADLLEELTGLREELASMLDNLKKIKI